LHSIDRAMRRLKLKDLRVLLAVNQHGSMGKAAAQLALSQPAISKSIADAEHSIGVRLFDRTAFGAEATIFGRALLKCAVAMFDDLRQGIYEIEQLNDPASGEVNIGATEPIVAGLLPAIISRLSRRFPRLIFRVIQIPTIRSYRELRERQVDLLLGRVAAAAPADDLQLELLFQDPPFVVAGKRNPRTRQRHLKLADLINDPWTLPHPDNVAGLLFSDIFRTAKLEPPRTQVFCNSIQMHNALLATGPYLAMYPRSLLHFSAKRLPVETLSVDFPRPSAPVGIVTLKKRMITPAVRLFIDSTREIAKPLSAASHGGI
jgi:DNA-binding transcriptional LysR family regulator